ncbi:MAG: FAD-dependent monooxygenase [Chloroflexi bacterium]|nr:FAD-dependent monooxygenase [Chloroflexota bacterium]
MKTQTVARRRALVLGASMAGLLTARVLSEHFDQVTILERDTVTAEPQSRKGQPQTRHLHGLLASGLQMLAHYFPDLPDALTENGAIVGDMAEKMHWHSYGGFRQRFHMGLKGATMSRPLLESLVRQRTLARPNITLRDNTAVKGLVTTTDRSKVVGVEVESRGASTHNETISADLVVDATGRGSRTPQWLTELGYAAPAESEVKVDVGYATRLYRRDPSDPLGQDWILSTPEAPRESRFGGIFPIESDRWIISIGGWAGDHAPTDEEGFLAFAHSLPNPDIYRIISQAEPLSKIIAYKFPASLRRHYEQLERFPQGLLVLGDAISSFNPTYGQGMSSAILQAAALDKILAQKSVAPELLARTFFKAAAAVVDTPWQLSVGEDFRFPQTTGPKPAGVDLINRYVAAVHRATRFDPEVGRAFLKVMNLLEPPTSLMTPGMMWRVWKANRANRQESRRVTEERAAQVAV